MNFLQNLLKQFWTEARRRLFGPKQPVIEPALVFERFRRVLNSNNQSLEIIADLGEKLGGGYIFDKHYIETGVERLRSTVKASIDGLNELCNHRFEDLYRVYDRLTGELELLLAGREDRQGPQIMALDAIHFLDWEIVGGKGARLAEMRQDSFLKVPDGFVITTKVYHDLIDHNDLRPMLDTFGKLMADTASDNSILEDLRRKLVREILQADPPPKLLDMLETAIESMAAGGGEPFSLAVRSSAQEEDMDFSFAGQFRSILNVKAKVGEVYHAYLRVVASLFSMEAVSYCRLVLPNERQMSIAAVCQRMVTARSSGVAFSVDTMAPDNETMVIVGAWGQGDAIVEGHIPTDTYIMNKDDVPVLLERTVVSKPQGRYQAETGGLETKKIEASRREQPCLDDAELLLLSRQVKHLELYYKRPQDVEWSVDDSGNLYILQARPLIIAEAALQNRSLPEALADYECIVAGQWQDSPAGHWGRSGKDCQRPCRSA